MHNSPLYDLSPKMSALGLHFKDGVYFHLNGIDPLVYTKELTRNTSFLSKTIIYSVSAKFVQFPSSSQPLYTNLFPDLKFSLLLIKMKLQSANELNLQYFIITVPLINTDCQYCKADYDPISSKKLTNG